jgi:hypothetical protein
VFYIACLITRQLKYILSQLGTVNNTHRERERERTPKYPLKHKIATCCRVNFRESKLQRLKVPNQQSRYYVNKMLEVSHNVKFGILHNYGSY